MYESSDKMVSHPSHYQSESGLEVIDVIEAFTAKLSGVKATDTGNILKYACRWNEKGTPIRDVEKIIWYATHLLEKLKAEEKGNEAINNSLNKFSNIMQLFEASSGKLSENKNVTIRSFVGTSSGDVIVR